MDKEEMPKLLSEFRMYYGKCISKELKAAGLHDLETSYGLIIQALASNEKQTMKELASSIGRDKSTVTVLVRKLEEKGYVLRSDHPVDQRSKNIILTQKAKDTYKTLKGISQDVNELTWTGIKKRECEQFLITLEKITANTKEHVNNK